MEEDAVEYSYSVKPVAGNIWIWWQRKLTNLYSPVAIYAWENKKCKNIPCIENFDILSKLYKCHVEDLYVLKQIDFSDFQVRENTPEYKT